MLFIDKKNKSNVYFNTLYNLDQLVNFDKSIKFNYYSKSDPAEHCLQISMHESDIDQKNYEFEQRFNRNYAHHFDKLNLSKYKKYEIPKKNTAKHNISTQTENLDKKMIE